MAAKLKHLYLALVAPVVAGFLSVYLLDLTGLFSFDTAQGKTILAPFLFTVSAFFALALPIFYRACFAYRRRHERPIYKSTFYSFQRNLLYIVLSTPYIALLAYSIHLPRFHQLGIFLMALYAAYYFYPSHKRLQLEQKLFKVSIERDKA